MTAGGPALNIGCHPGTPCDPRFPVLWLCLTGNKVVYMKKLAVALELALIPVVAIPACTIVGGVVGINISCTALRSSKKLATSVMNELLLGWGVDK